MLLDAERVTRAATWPGFHDSIYGMQRQRGPFGGRAGIGPSPRDRKRSMVRQFVEVIVDLGSLMPNGASSHLLPVSVLAVLDGAVIVCIAGD